MPQSAEKFAQLLTEGVHRIRLRERKNLSVVQDELGYALGRAGGSAIQYWRKGHLPSNVSDVAELARLLVSRGQVDQAWLVQFLESAGYPHVTAFYKDLWGAQIETTALRASASRCEAVQPKPAHQDWGAAPAAPSGARCSTRLPWTRSCGSGCSSSRATNWPICPPLWTSVCACVCRPTSARSLSSSSERSRNSSGVTS